MNDSEKNVWFVSSFLISSSFEGVHFHFLPAACGCRFWFHLISSVTTCTKMHLSTLTAAIWISYLYCRVKVMFWIRGRQTSETKRDTEREAQTQDEQQSTVQVLTLTGFCERATPLSRLTCCPIMTGDLGLNHALSLIVAPPAHWWHRAQSIRWSWANPSGTGHSDSRACNWHDVRPSHLCDRERRVRERGRYRQWERERERGQKVNTFVRLGGCLCSVNWTGAD